jgi:hypothetical protein
LTSRTITWSAQCLPAIYHWKICRATSQWKTGHSRAVTGDYFSV